MAVSNTLTVLLLSLIICIQGLEQRPSLGSRSKRDTLASSMFSAFTNLEKRVAAVEATAQCDNSTEERLVQLEAEMTKLQEKMSALDKRLEDISINAVNLHNSSMLAIQGIVHTVAASEQSFKATMRSATEIMVSMMSALETRLLDKAENNAAMFNASIVRVEQTTKELSTRVSAVEKEMHSVMERTTASEQIMFTMQNSSEILASMINDTEAQLLAIKKDNVAVVNASITRLEQTTKELATRMSAVKDKLDNATSLLKNTTEEMCGTPKYKRTCQDYYDDGQRTSGVYTLDLEDGRGPMEVYCDMRNGTGWVVFQRREDGSVDFYRDWKSYRDGFGDLYGEFWLGNRNIHRLTSAGLTQLRVDLQAWNGSRAFASYSHFSVGDASSSYTLSVSGYSGTAGDSLGYNNGHKFTTIDRDEDIWGGNCAQNYKGAWWHRDCTYSNLNGEYGTRDSNGGLYVYWNHWLGSHSLQRTELKLK